jgi:hypothetical protein
MSASQKQTLLWHNRRRSFGVASVKTIKLNEDYEHVSARVPPHIVERSDAPLAKQIKGDTARELICKILERHHHQSNGDA